MFTMHVIITFIITVASVTVTSFCYVIMHFVNVPDIQSSSLDVPLEILDADLFAGFIIIVIPFSICEFDFGELCARINAFGEPGSL